MFDSILIPVDLAHQTQVPRLLESALKLMHPDGNTQLHFVYVDDSHVHQGSFSQLDPKQESVRKAMNQDRLVALLRNYLPAGVQYTSYLREGSIHEEVLEFAKQLEVGAIVVMAARPGLASYFVGSNAERIVRHAQCSVFVVRE